MLKRICANRTFNISLIFVGLMFLLPFVNLRHQLPISSFYAEWLAATLGLAAAFPLLRTTSWQNIQIPKISLVFLGLTVILITQWTLGMLHSTQYALIVLSYFTWASLLVVLGNYLRRKLGWERLVTTLAWYLVLAGIINVGIAVLQFVTKTGGVIPFLPNLPSYGALSQPNHFANFTALAIASLIYLYAKARFSLSFFILILICFLIMLSLSGSRSAWLYLTALTFFAAALHINALKRNTYSTEIRHTFRMSLLLIPAFILVQLFIYYVVPNELVNLPTERLADSANVNTASARLQIWYDSLRLFSQSPWLGIGAGTTRAESFLLLDNPSVMGFNHVFEHAHNLFLHLLAEMGIGAFLIVLIGLLEWIRAFKWRELGLETWWLISLLAVLGIHSMLEYPLWFTYFLGIAAVLLGAGDENLVTINLPKITSKLSYKFIRLSLVVVLLLGVVNLCTLLIANVKLENWIHKFAFENVNEQVQLDWANQHSLLSPYADLLSTISMTVNPSEIDNQVQLSQSVMHFKPLRKIAYQHALLLRLQGDHTGAKEQLNRALIAYPENFKGVLETMPLKYRQDYLDILSEARPKQKNEIMAN
ncbi:MAG: Wzy polymerase domain-containing protein [Methylotenera sp.]